MWSIPENRTVFDEGLQRRAEGPATLTWGQAQLNFQGISLTNQIRQYQPNYSYSYASAPAQGFTATNIMQLQGVLQRLQKNPTCTNRVISIEDQAAQLVPLNGGRSRVTLRSEEFQLQIDLIGRSHNGIPTPHTKEAARNWRAPSHLQPVYNTTERQSELRPATQSDIRNARRYLERMQ